MWEKKVVGMILPSKDASFFGRRMPQVCLAVVLATLYDMRNTEDIHQDIYVGYIL
jgi:hypothetical protein